MKKTYGLTDSTVLSKEAENLSLTSRALLSMMQNKGKGTLIWSSDVRQLHAYVEGFKLHHARLQAWPELVKNGLVRSLGQHSKNLYPYVLTDKGAAFEMLAKEARRIVTKTVEVDTAHISSRKEISPTTKRWHVENTHRLGGRCQCCLITFLVNSDGTVIKGAGNFDHFWANHRPNADATWFICIKCHSRSTNEVTHDECWVHFKSYQDRANKLREDEKQLRAAE